MEELEKRFSNGGPRMIDKEDINNYVKLKV